jgi:hypothetical protein
MELERFCRDGRKKQKTGKNLIMTKEITKNTRNFRNGSVSLVAVLFGTVVMSLIVISFIRAMNSGLAQNLMYTTSQAAYDAAITGLNDSQFAISECRRNPGSASDLNSQRYKDCLLILQGGNDADATCERMMEAVKNVIGITEAGVVDSESNQKYTCLEIKPSTVSLRGELRGSGGAVHVPILTAGDGEVEWVRVLYGRGMNAASSPSASAGSPCSGNIYGFEQTLQNRANLLCNGKFFKNAGSSTELVAVSFELKQTAASFDLDDTGGSRADQTNHGYLALSPTANPAANTPNVKNIGNTLVTVSGEDKVRVGLAGSADKANNSPAPVYCKSGAFESERSDKMKFDCETFIKLPNPIDSVSRDELASFISLSLPAAENPTSVDMSFYAAGVNENSPGSRVDMGEIQYEVYVQGQTGDRVRRIMAYVGGINGSRDIIPKWSAGITGGGIIKCDNAVNANTVDLTNSGNCKDEDAEGKIIDEYANFTDYVICEHQFYTRDRFGNDVNKPADNQNGLRKCGR